MGIIVRNEKTYTGISSASLSTLTDVALETPVNGQGLVYNEETQTWTNGNIASGGGIGTSADVEWGIMTLEADLQVATPIGYTIPFNQFFSQSTAEIDKENSGFILKAGKTYELEAIVRTLGASEYRYFQFYNNNKQTLFGVLGCSETMGNYSDAVVPVKWTGSVDEDTLVTLRCVNTSSETSTTTILLQSRFSITELKSSVTYVDGTIKPWLYSEEETIIGNYLGKPLYRKIIKDIDLYTYDNSLVIENIDTLVGNIYGRATYINAMDGSTAYSPIPAIVGGGSSDRDYQLSFNIGYDNGIINISKGNALVSSNYSSITANIILEYTKTTDEEGSGDSLMPYCGGSISNTGITIMTQNEFDNVTNKSNLGIIGICDWGYEITKLIDTSILTDDYWEMPHTFTSNEMTIDDINYILSASSYVDTARDAYKAFDNSLDSVTGCWHSANVELPHLLTIQTSVPIKLRQFKIVNRAETTYGINSIKDFELQVSNDGVAWTTLGSFTNQDGFSAESIFNVNSQEYYQYHRLYITSVYNIGDFYGAIGELYLIGKKKI